MKKFFIFILILLGSYMARADHITGGEMFYTFVGIVNGEYRYQVTLKFFMRCNSGRQFYSPAVISIYNKKTNTLLTNIDAPLANQQRLSLSNSNPCITNPPTVCYEVGVYHFIVSLPSSADGYLLSSQVTYRINTINNLSVGYSQVGATYTAEIPGTSDIATGSTNSSAVFTGNDLVIVCADNSFSYSFAAMDVDGDQLRYSFCNAYQNGSGGGGGGSSAPGPPPYPSVPYGGGFSGTGPLGSNVHIDPNTGLITGIAPPAGTYVVTVCVDEIRNGVVIATQRKDLQINIAPCTIAGATLLQEYMLCKNTKTIFLTNLSTSPLVKTQHWKLLDRAGNLLFSSTDPGITYTFADTGTYTIKLSINSGQACSDSTSSLARVYPGFVPAISYSGVCFKKPTLFKDASTTVYGTVNSRSWDLGDVSNSTDESTLASPAYTYLSMGIKNAQLIVTNTVGCRDTVLQNISIIDKPPLKLAFSDTLICVKDGVQLQAGATGVFSWSPNVNIVNSASATPTVKPTTSTTYFVELNDNGCLNKDSVKVRVTDHVTLQVMKDTTICQGDTIQLRIVSDGFRYSWTPASQLNNPRSANPHAVTNMTTPYSVTASIGSCQTTASVNITAIPYPLANAGKDTTICFDSQARLNASMVGDSVIWSPASSLSNRNLLDPIATPTATTTYKLLVYERTKGCPKPGKDEMEVVVLPDINAFAGRDTAIVRGQPLQLTATGNEAVRYLWFPSTELSNDTLAAPFATSENSRDHMRYKVYVYNKANCVDSAFISVLVYKTFPSVFVPNAFTPNADGKNDLLRPIAVGMKHIEYFKVYNRFGQLVFSTSFNRQGWDGTIRGNLQNSGGYVWIVKAIDYTGAPYFQKGTATLIR